MDIINWFIENSQVLYNILIGTLAVIAYIVKLTPSDSDDKWYAGLLEFLRKISWIK